MISSITSSIQRASAVGVLLPLFALSGCIGSENSALKGSDQEEGATTKSKLTEYSMSYRIYRNPSERFPRFSELLPTKLMRLFSLENGDKFRIFMRKQVSSKDDRAWISFLSDSGTHAGRKVEFNFFVDPKFLTGQERIQECTYGYSIFASGCEVLSVSSGHDENRAEGFLPSYFPDAPIRCVLEMNSGQVGFGDRDEIQIRARDMGVSRTEGPIEFTFRCEDLEHQVEAASGHVRTI